MLEPHLYYHVCAYVWLGMIVAVGLSSLQHCDMSSSRNIFIVGLSLFTGLAVPQWIQDNQSSIQTGMHFFLHQVYSVETGELHKNKYLHPLALNPSKLSP